MIFRNDVVFLDCLGLNSYKVIELGDSRAERFIIYNLSDALWAFSLMLYVSTQDSTLIRIVGLSIPLTMELLQYFKVIAGDFDILDIEVYAIISTLFYSIWKKRKEI